MLVNCQTRLSNSFHYQDLVPKDLVSAVVYEFQYGLCNESYYGKSIRHLDIGFAEYIDVSPLMERISDHQVTVLFVIIYSTVIFASFGNFSILADENKKCLLEIKESLLIMRQTLTK